VTAQQAIAYVFVAGVLIALADFRQTEPLATALALLILISILLVYGTTAIANVQSLVGGGPTTSGGEGGGGGGATKTIR
jgi:hypothetical protein